MLFQPFNILGFSLASHAVFEKVALFLTSASTNFDVRLNHNAVFKLLKQEWQNIQILYKFINLSCSFTLNSIKNCRANFCMVLMYLGDSVGSNRSIVIWLILRTSA